MEILTRSHFTREFCTALVQEYLTARNAAMHLHGRCINIYGKPAGLTTVSGWINQGVAPPITGREDNSKVSRIETLLARANVPLSSIGNIDKVTFSQWGYQQKDADGNPIEGVLDSTQIVMTPQAPAFPVVTQAAPNVIQFNDAPRIMKATKTVVILSDCQVGHLKDLDSGVLEPIHDTAAMRVAELITAAEDPDEIICIGDYMDWAMLSRWQQHDEFDTVNEAIQEGYDWLCRFKAAAPNASKFVMISGNHDIRPEKFLLEHNRKAMRIRRASDTSEWPVFTQGYLLRYDELGITCPGTYPGGEYYITPDLLAIHAPPRAGEFQASIIHGHDHKLTRETRVQHSSEGRKTYFRYSVGCLCQTGITSNPQRLMRTRVPSDRARTSWAQGMATVDIVEGKIPLHAVNLITIENGLSLFKGELFNGKAENTDT